MIPEVFRCPICGLAYHFEKGAKWCVDVYHPCQDAGHLPFIYESVSDINRDNAILIWKKCRCECANKYERIKLEDIPQNILIALFEYAKNKE